MTTSSSMHINKAKSRL